MTAIDQMATPLFGRHDRSICLELPPELQLIKAAYSIIRSQHPLNDYSWFTCKGLPVQIEQLPDGCGIGVVDGIKLDAMWWLDKASSVDVGDATDDLFCNASK